MVTMRCGSPKPWIPPWELETDSERHVQVDGDGEETPQSSRRSPKAATPRAGSEPPLSDQRRGTQEITDVLNRILPVNSKKTRTSTKRGTVFAQRKTMTVGRRTFSVPPPDGAGFPIEAGSTMTVSMSMASAQDRRLDAADVVALRSSLTRTFGNLSRAIRAMKIAASVNFRNDEKSGRPQGQGRCTLNREEFVWCVTSLVKHGDRALAGRLFGILDRNGDGEVGLLELSQPHARTEGLMSLVEFRRRLLERHRSLWQAFRELEENLDNQTFFGRAPLVGGGGSVSSTAAATASGRQRRCMRLKEFVDSTTCFGLAPHQATHFFSTMDADGNGVLTMEEFMDALTKMPRHVLLQDLRQRFLGRHSSLSAAFDAITTAGLGGGKQRVNQSPAALQAARLTRPEFGAALARLGVADAEADELFRIIDADNSGDVSLTELREALRDVAPAIALETFWQRFDAEFPQVASLLRESRLTRSPDVAKESLRKAGELMATFLPKELQNHLVGDPSQRRKKDDPLVLTHLNSKSFDAVAARLDVSSANVSDLFARISQTAKALHPRLGRDSSPEPEPDSSRSKEVWMSREVQLEDFATLFQLWIDNPTPMTRERSSGNRATMQLLRQAMGPAQERCAALKKELKEGLKSPRPSEVLSPTSSGGPSPSGADPTSPPSDRRGSSDTGKRSRSRPPRPNMPWVAPGPAPKVLQSVFVAT